MRHVHVRFGIRSLFVAAAVVIVTGIAATAYLLMRPPAAPGHPAQPVAQNPTPIDPVAIHRTWQETVVRQISTLSDASSNDEITKVQESLMGLTVTAADRDAHLTLILDLIAWERKEAGAEARVRSDADKISK